MCLHFVQGGSHGTGAPAGAKIRICCFRGSTLGKRWHALGRSHQRHQRQRLLRGHDQSFDGRNTSPLEDSYRNTRLRSARDCRLFTYPSWDGIGVWTDRGKISGCPAKTGFPPQAKTTAYSFPIATFPDDFASSKRVAAVISRRTYGLSACVCPG